MVAAATIDLAGVVGGLLAAAVGAWATREGWLTWRGREHAFVTRSLEQPPGRRATPLGGRTLFATFLGSGLGLLVAGPGVVAVGLGLAFRSTVDTTTEPWWWWVASIVGMVLVGAGLLYVLAYLWVDLPDALRPPAQRGQPRPGRVGPDGQVHPLDRIDARNDPVDLGPDPTRPPWARGDPAWVTPGRRPPEPSIWDDDRW